MKVLKSLYIAMIYVMAALFGFCAFKSLALGQDLPIQSQDVLRECALGKVVRGSRMVDSPSMVWDKNTFASFEAEGNGAESVLDKLFGVQFQFSLSNPGDLVEGHVWLYDAQDNLLFYGRTEYRLADLDKNGPSYGIWMQYIPILSGVQSAEVLVLDKDGITVRREPLEVRNGEILFPPWMSGVSNGILSARFKDGQVMTWNLWAPEGQTPGVFSETGSWKIEGHYVFSPSDKDVILVKIIETWLRPTVLITVKAGQSVRFDVSGLVQSDGQTYFESPLSGVFQQVDGPWAGAFNLGQEFNIVFPAPGQYRLRFDWKEFGLPGRLYDGPTESGGDSGGGKGY